MGLLFEWNPAKARANLSKHGVRFDEALTVFDDPLARIFADGEHSQYEVREIVIGHAVSGRLLVVAFTEPNEGRVRVISARKATYRERHDYEENVGH